MKRPDTSVSRREALGTIGAAGLGAAAAPGSPAAGHGAGAAPSNDVLPKEVLRHGAYVCLREAGGDAPAGLAPKVAKLIDRLGLHNEFTAHGHPSDAVAFLKRAKASPGDLADDGLRDAQAVVHVASRSEETVAGFCTGLERLLGPGRSVVVRRGVVRPPAYTGAAMHNFAYAHQVVQQPAEAMPHAFLLPLRKTAEWWRKGWMERHTYLLPRFDESGRMTSEGHALAAAAGVAGLMRRTYKWPSEPAPEGEYDFLTYFECADDHVPTFHAVCAALRNRDRNPEWRYVREGPTWQGRRVGSWADLFPA